MLKPVIALSTMALLVARPAHAEPPCYVDHVEAAAGGLDVFVDKMSGPPPYGVPLSVYGPDEKGGAFLFTYTQPRSVIVDGEPVYVPPPDFTYMAIGDKG